MSIQEKIEYDKVHRKELVQPYKAYIKAIGDLIDTDWDLIGATAGNPIGVKSLGCHETGEYGFELIDIFHFYYVLKSDLTAALCPDGRYCISFTAHSTEYQIPFEVYEYVDEDTYKSVYQNISERVLEMPDHP